MKMKGNKSCMNQNIKIIIFVNNIYNQMKFITKKLVIYKAL